VVRRAALRIGRPANTALWAKVFVLPSTSGRNAGADRGVKMRYFRELADYCAV